MPLAPLSRKPFAAIALAAVFAGAGAGAFNYFQNVEFAQAEQRIDATREQLSSVADLASVFKSVNKVLEPSVVSIEVKKTVRVPNGNALPGNIPREFRRYFDRDGDGTPDLPGGQDGDEPDEPMIQRGTGSGVIVEVDGSTAYVVTNNHVAGDAQEMEITLSDGRIVKNGKLLGADPKSDLAVIKMTVDRVIPAKWGDSDRLGKGDWVLAFGSPLGYVGSMTHGIVSALNRQSSPEGGVGVLGPGGYENFIQVDCPINPGNSGGPLASVQGEVVGINTAIASRTGGFQGIGFAIPSNQARPIYESLKNNGKVTRGWLGVEIVDVARVPDEARSTGFTGDVGVLVKGALRGTPAFGKLRPGDVITGIAGKPVRTTQELRNQIAMTAPGTELQFGVSRGGQAVDVPVKVGEQPDDVTIGRRPGGAGGGAEGDDADRQATVDAMGLRLSDATEQLRTRHGLADAGDGAVVTEVAPRSPAAQAGLRAGDLITKVNDADVASAADADAAFDKADTSKGLSLYVANKDGSRFVFVPADAFAKRK